MRTVRKSGQAQPRARLVDLSICHTLVRVEKARKTSDEREQEEHGRIRVMIIPT